MIFKKKNRFAALCALSLALLLPVCGGCAVQDLSSLRAFAMPCAGEYECVYAHLGEKDLLAGLRSLTLSLERDGSFSATAVSRSGKTKKKGGTWSFDEEKSELTFSTRVLGKTRTKTARMQGGSFTLQQRMAGKNLVLTFRILP